MASKYWIKFYHEVIDDPKMGRLPDNLWRRFFECCLLAGELDDSGRLPSLDDIAWRLRIGNETLQGELNELLRLGLLECYGQEHGPDYWQVKNFGKRQGAMTGAERVKRHRETKKKQDYYEGGNDSVTESVTVRYTDKDKDKEEEKEPDFFFFYENKIGTISPAISSGLNELKNNYPAGWIIDAIEKAADSNKRSLGYIKGILSNWQSQGRGANGKAAGPTWQQQFAVVSKMIRRGVGAGAARDELPSKTWQAIENAGGWGWYGRMTPKDARFAFQIGYEGVAA